MSKKNAMKKIDITLYTVMDQFDDLAVNSNLPTWSNPDAPQCMAHTNSFRGSNSTSKSRSCGTAS